MRTSLRYIFISICLLTVFAGCRMSHRERKGQHMVLSVELDTAMYYRLNGRAVDPRGLMSQTIWVIKSRFLNIGLDTELCEITGRGLLITVKIWGTDEQKINKESIRRALVTSAKLGFWETYSAKQVYGFIFPGASGNDTIKEIRYRLRQLITPDSNYIMSDYGMNSSLLGYAHLNNKYEIDQLLSKLFLPADLKWMWGVKPQKGGTMYPIYLLKGKEPLLTNNVITEAKVYYDEQSGSGKPQISLTMNDKGTVLWERITGENINKDIAMTIDDRVYVCPKVMSKISGGRSSIAGDFTDQEAKDMAALLNVGALPVPLGLVEEKVDN